MKVTIRHGEIIMAQLEDTAGLDDKLEQFIKELEGLDDRVTALEGDSDEKSGWDPAPELIEDTKLNMIPDPDPDRHLVDSAMLRSVFIEGAAGWVAERGRIDFARGLMYHVEELDKTLKEFMVSMPPTEDIHNLRQEVELLIKTIRDAEVGDDL